MQKEMIDVFSCCFFSESLSKISVKIWICQNYFIIFQKIVLKTQCAILFQYKSFNPHRLSMWVQLQYNLSFYYHPVGCSTARRTITAGENSVA